MFDLFLFDWFQNEPSFYLWRFICHFDYWCCDWFKKWTNILGLIRLTKWEPECLRTGSPLWTDPRSEGRSVHLHPLRSKHRERPQSVELLTNKNVTVMIQLVLFESERWCRFPWTGLIRDRSPGLPQSLWASEPPGDQQKNQVETKCWSVNTPPRSVSAEPWWCVTDVTVRVQMQPVKHTHTHTLWLVTVLLLRVLILLPPQPSETF